jgi:hypothetical protein
MLIIRVHRADLEVPPTTFAYPDQVQDAENFVRKAYVAPFLLGCNLDGEDQLRLWSRMVLNDPAAHGGFIQVRVGNPVKNPMYAVEMTLSYSTPDSIFDHIRVKSLP